MSEMGRTPKINGNAGRDHWTYCYSVRVRRGRHPRRHGLRRVRRPGGLRQGPAGEHGRHLRDDLPCLGIDPEFRVPDKTNRPIAIAHGGRAMEEILT